VQPALSPGELVRVRGRDWRVHAVTRYGGCRQLDLDPLDADGRRDPRRRVALLEPFDKPARMAVRASARVVSPRAWVAALGRAVLRRREPFGLVAPIEARIDLLPHQLEPALAVIHGGFTRLLLADAVGLGKTIEAGLVLAELRARGGLSRGLVLVPPGLRDQWAAELADRFGLDATVADAAWLRARRAELPATVNPWSLPGIFVSSFDFAKRAEVLPGLEPLSWDALVLDEAHLAAGDSERRAAAHALASRARVVLLLTATPHSGDPRVFQALCRIGCLGPGDRPAVFMRKRAQAGLDRARRVSVLRVRASPAELELRRRLVGYIRRVWAREAGARPGNARLAMTVLLKRSFSGVAPLRRSIEARLAGLEGGGPAAIQLPFAWDEDLDAADDEPFAALASPGLADAGEERAVLEDLAREARAIEADDSKLRAVLKLIRRAPEPALVFTEYRDTLSALRQAAGESAGVLHGGLDRAARAEALSRFVGGGTRVLLATDAAGEGLNLHERCRLVVNLELPWNPMRLEQRIGRVDRIGQPREVRVVNLVAAGSAEERLFARLASRLERAREAVGPIEDMLGSLDEDVVADQIGLGLPFVQGAWPAPAEPLEPAGLTVCPLELSARAGDLAAWLAVLRRLFRAAARRAPRGGRGGRRRSAGGVAVAARRHVALPAPLGRRGVLALFRVARGRPGGLAAWTELTPVFVERRVPRLRRAGDIRALADAFVRDEAPALASAVAARFPRAGPAEPLFDRDACLARRARRRRAVQRGLFDARAEREARAEAEPAADAGAPAAAAGAQPSAAPEPAPELILLLFITG